MAAFLSASSDIRITGSLGASSLGVTAAGAVIDGSLFSGFTTIASAALLVFFTSLVAIPVAATLTGASLVGLVILAGPLAVAVVLVFEMGVTVGAVITLGAGWP